MINIIERSNCCGCSACVQICPKQCISFNEDERGFRYPLVDTELCIDCHLCENVCPFINQYESRKPLKVYAAKNPNEEMRKNSSSGGIFTMLSETIIDEGGVVFGARYDKKWEVMHDYTETKKGLEAFRGSKYVQSRIGEAYKQARDFLNDDRKVLFSGTSCQISGLKKFLRKDYDNLLTIDVVCHGVPSPLVWREYLPGIIERPKGVVGKKSVLSSPNEEPVITDISFRDKTKGWKKYGFVIRGMSASKADKNTVLSSDTIVKELFHEVHLRNWYMQLFLRSLNLRSSCFNCPSKDGRSNSDITLADFWSIKLFYPKFYDNKGVSIILANTNKAIDYIQKLHCTILETSYKEALVYNMSIEKSEDKGIYYDSFWEAYGNNDRNKINQILKSTEESTKYKIHSFLRDWAYSHIYFLRNRLKQKDENI